ncbi:MAG: hypothetical protein ACD_9C00170G0005 [uncultured bacterium]|nr:MAG: hypothetical protein ACD_9C00170G0005 [uncultured bacterium]
MQRDPEVRDKKVYLDYLQNRWGQTMAAVYCVRPKAGAPVSTPLEWKELNEKLNPQEFNIKTIFSRLQEKGDIWKDIFKKRKVDLSAAVILLEKVISKQQNKNNIKM